MAHNSKNREFLLTGYVRNNCGTECPTDLINFLAQWINLRNGVVFKFVGHELKRFCKTQQNVPFKHEDQEEYYTIKLPDKISISCKIYPRYVHRKDYERVMFQLTASAPTTISIFEYYLEIRCEEMDNWVYKEIITSNTDYINAEKRYSWPISVIEQSNKQTITFYVYAELLRIMEKDTLRKVNFMKDVSINSRIKHKWVLDEKLLMQLRDDRFEGIAHYLESIEDDCFGLYIMSKKKKKAMSWQTYPDEGKLQFIAGLYTFKVPTLADGIQGRLSVSIATKCLDQTKIKEIDWETFNDDLYVEFGSYKEWRTKMTLDGVNRIEIDLNLDITKVRYDSKYIDKDEWDLYGIYTPNSSKGNEDDYNLTI